MKTTAMFFLTVFAVVSAAAGCPDLSGEFNCKTVGVISISQLETGGVTSYVFNGSAPVPADGVARSVPDTTAARETQVKYWCEGAVLKSTLDGFYDDGFISGRRHYVLQMSVDTDGLHVAVEGELGPVPISANETCARR